MIISSKFEPCFHSSVEGDAYSMAPMAIPFCFVAGINVFFAGASIALSFPFQLLRVASKPLPFFYAPGSQNGATHATPSSSGLLLSSAAAWGTLATKGEMVMAGPTNILELFCSDLLQILFMWWRGASLAQQVARCSSRRATNQSIPGI